MQEKIFRLGEFFCGPGGLALGAKEARVKNTNTTFSIQHVWATDYDKDSCATYHNNICPENKSSVICRDVRNLDLNSLKKISEIDAFSFGFPCNDFSVVGEQKGINGAYGPLYDYGVKAIHMFKPKFFLAENVGGLRNANEGKTFKTILNALFKEGYSIYPHLYKFNMYGVPQNRQRIIIIGIRKDIDLVFAPPSTSTFQDIDVSSKKAIESPPIPQNAYNHEQTKQSQQVIKRLSYIKPGENAFTADIPEELKLDVRGAKISQIYRRLAPDKPAYTVTGSGGGGTHMYHWKEHRALTNRERARLQTFPDNFIFCGSKESVRKQIGMAVPCQGAKIIFETILKCFAGISYSREPPSITPFLHETHRELYNEHIATQFSMYEKAPAYGI